jgi:hypothetical protein
MALTPQRTLQNRILVVLSSRDGGTGTRAEVLADLETAFKAQWTAEGLQSPDSRPLAIQPSFCMEKIPSWRITNW